MSKSKTKVKIIGGFSSDHRISIQSNEFRVTARYDQQSGEISTEVKRLPRLSRFLYTLDRLPIPRLVVVLLFILGQLKIKVSQALVVALVILVALTMGVLSPHTPSAPGQHLPVPYPTWIELFVFMLLFMAYSKLYIAPWHGAEHMAIAAYQRTGATSLAAFQQESPVHPKCGGRFFLPIVVLQVVAAFSATSLWFGHPLFFFGAVLECTLWLDKLVGLDRLPITAQASRLLQQYVTTRQPTQKELRTAQVALRKLLEQHNQ